jgi:peptidoglycan/LPS O-acetylase OafA/YrhL
VSVEVALYLVFFVVVRSIGAKAWVPLAGFALAYLLNATYESAVSHAMLPFFAGGVAYVALGRIVRRNRTAIALTVLAPITVALWTLAVSGAYPSSRWARNVVWVWELHGFFTCAVLFPITILCLAVLETRHPTIGRRVAVLGDVSYSSYLLHFPLQLLCVLLVTVVGIEHSILLSPRFMLGFLAVLLLLSYASFRWFERPLQRMLRARWQSSGSSR